MTQLALAIAAVTVLMFCQDLLGTGLMLSEKRELRVFPGLFDGAGDFVNRYGGGVSAYAVLHWGLGSIQFFVITLAVATTSYFTSNLAVSKGSKILPQNDLEHVTLAEMWERLKSTTHH